MESIIGVSRENFIYKGDVYNINDFKDHIKEISKKRKFIIIGEELRIRSYKIIENIKNIDLYIDKLIVKDFIKDSDCLFHYELNKYDKEVIIYSIRNGRIIEKFSRGARNIKVRPVQFIIKDYIHKTNRKISSYAAIINLNNIYYFLGVKNNKIKKSYLSKSMDDITEKVFKSDMEYKNLVLDKNINFNLEGLEILKVYNLNIGEKINGHIFKK